MTTTIALKNFRSITNKTFDMEGKVTLIAGPNGSGKTNVILALRSLLTGEALPPSLLKKDAKVMVADGAREATASIGNESWSVTGHWPDGKIDTVGTPPSISRIAAGMVNVCELSDEERAALIGEVIGSTPTAERLTAELKAIGVPEEFCAPKAVEVLKHWPTAVAKAATTGVELKQSFKSATGETWGINKGGSWVPKEWTADLARLSVEELQQKVDQCEAILNDVKKNAVVASHTKEQAEDAARKRIGLQSRSNDLAMQIDKLTDERNKIALPVAEPQKCPDCHVSLIVDATGKIVHAPSAVDSAENTRRRTERDRLAAAIKALEAERDPVENEIAVCKQIEAANTTPGKCTTADVMVAQTEYTNALSRLNMRKARDNAAEIHEKLVLNSKAQALLADDGLKRTVLLEKLEGLNKGLADFSAAAAWSWNGTPAVVSVDTDLKVRFAGRDYRWGISEAQQFRTAVTMQVVLAIMGGSQAVLIDRADVLDAQGRNGLVTAIEASGLAHAFIGMTISAREVMPDLAAAGIGASYWMGE